MVTTHRQLGHKGRDNFYNAIKEKSTTVTKDFCNSFVKVCCPKAAHWNNGRVNLGWLPSAESRATTSSSSSSSNGRKRKASKDPIDDNTVNGNNVLSGNKRVRKSAAKPKTGSQAPVPAGQFDEQVVARVIVSLLFKS